MEGRFGVGVGYPRKGSYEIENSVPDIEIRCLVDDKSSVVELAT